MPYLLQEASNCVTKAKQEASKYLTNRADEIANSNEIFHMAISAYALSLGSQGGTGTIFKELLKHKRSGKVYFDTPHKKFAGIYTPEHSLTGNVFFYLDLIFMLPLSAF